MSVVLSQAASRLGMLCVAAALGACTTASIAPNVETAPTAPSAPSASGPSAALDSAPNWQAVALPGKRPTQYRLTTKEGRSVVHAQADGSASMWRRAVSVPPEQLGSVRLSWWVDRLIERAHVGDAEREDAVARVVFAFEGDRSTLSARTRALFDLAQALTGEAPPYATLMYVFDTEAPVGSVIVNPRTDRVRKIVLDSGAHGGQTLRRWRDHQRDLAADFRQAFGEEPGRLVGIAVMTDGDNTRSRAQAWYGPIELLPPP